MANTVASRKSKGRRLQQYVVEKIRTVFDLGTRDVKSVPMGVNGPDVELSEKAFVEFPFSVECKNSENLSIWKALKQAETEAEGIPLLVFTRNRSETYCAMRLSDFFTLVVPTKEEEDTNG